MSTAVSGEGTVLAPTYYEGPADDTGDVHLSGRYYTYRTDDGLVAGATTSIMFTIDRPVRDVWPYVKDFNLWQSQFNHHYSGVIGDLDGKTFGLGGDPEKAQHHRYKVVRVIPEHVIAVYQSFPEDPDEKTGLPGVQGPPGVSPGFHVFMCNEHEGKTVVTIFMEHAAYASRTQDMTDEEALAPWRDPGMLPEWIRKWRDDFIPTLKNLVYGES